MANNRSSANCLRAGRNSALAFVIVLVLGLSLSNHAYARESLKLAVDVWLPYENIGNEDTPGFSTEVVTSVLQNMGIEWDLKEYSWARALKEVFEGRRDALFTAFWTEERARYCHFPDEPLAKERWVFFVRRKDAQQLRFASYDEIKDRRIGVLRGASVTEEFWEFVRSHRNYEEVTTDRLNFKKLLAGRIDYVVTSYSNGVELGKQMAISDQIDFLRSPVITEDNLYIIFSKKSVSPEFVNSFSRALTSFKSSDRYRAIHDKYFALR